MTNDKKAIVTGSGRGIGRAIAELLLEEGWSVYGISKNLPLPPFQNARYCHTALDFNDKESFLKKLTELKLAIGKVDALVSNAGKGEFKHLEQFSFRQIEDFIGLNLLSHLFLIKTFLPEMKKRKSGDIILIGSESALQGKRQGSLYSACKFALRGFSQALRDECSISDVRVSVINPGMTKTAFFDHLDFEPGSNFSESIEPEDIARAVLMVINARKGTVFDEINLSPQKKRILKKQRA